MNWRTRSPEGDAEIVNRHISNTRKEAAKKFGAMLGAAILVSAFAYLLLGKTIGIWAAAGLVIPVVVAWIILIVRLALLARTTKQEVARRRAEEDS